MAYTFQTTTDGSVGTREGVLPGWYEAVVLSATEKNSRASGELMIELCLGVDVGRAKPFELRSWLVLTSKAAWKIEQFLAATGKRFAKGEQVTIDARTCEGKRLCVTLCNRVTDKGGVFPEVLDFRRREDCPHMGAMTEEELRQWDLLPDGTRKPREQREAEVSRQMGQVRRDAGLAPATRAASRQGDPLQWEKDMADDDIPF